MKKIGIYLLAFIALSSCVSKKKFQATQTEKDKVEMSLRQTTSDLAECEKKFASKSSDYDALTGDLAKARQNAADLQKLLDEQKATSGKLLDRMSDLSVISKTGAESIRQSLETLDKQNATIVQLYGEIKLKDSLNMTLMMNLKRSLTDVNDQDVNVKVEKGVVLISLSDNMLFKTGKADISPAAGAVLEKIAKVINDYNQMDVLIEGNTDNVPISTACFLDNWDLSAKRATSIARYLQTKSGVAPIRMIAGGRGEYNPKAPNDTPENKAVNRRTEILILPRLDEFFKLLERPQPK